MYKHKLLQIGMFFALIFVLVLFLLSPSMSYANANTNVSDWINNANVEGKDTLPAAETKETTSAAVGFSAWEFIKMFLALGFVIVLLYALLKFMNKRNMKYQQNQIVQNLGGLSLGVQKSVQLIQVGDALLVVGVGEDIQLLKEITDRDQIEKILDLYNDRQELAAATPYIAELVGKFKTTKANNNQSNVNDQVFSDMLQKKLATIKKQRKQEIEEWKNKEEDK